MLLTVDASLAGTGWAVFDHGELVLAGVVATKPSEPLGDRLGAAGRQLASAKGIVEQIIFEVPKFYSEGQAKANGHRVNPQHLAKLWGVVGGIAAFHPGVPMDFVLPYQWKGSVDPIAMFRRIVGRLKEDELAVFNRNLRPKSALDDRTAPKSKDDRAGDALDAIGIGLWHLGRLGRRTSK